MPAREKFLIDVTVSLTILLFFPKVAFAQVVINELLPNPIDGPDWVELYNTTDEDVSLNGWILDDEGTTTNMVEIKEASISAKGFLVFAVGSRLNKNSDTIYLKNNEGLTIDKYSYTEDPGSGVSFGRMPDGGDWGICFSPTKMGANNCFFPSPTPIPSPTPTFIPTNTPTSKPQTPTPTPTPTAKLSIPTSTSTPTPKSTPTLKNASAEATESGEILGEEEEATVGGFYPLEATEEAGKVKEATSTGKKNSKNKILGGIFIGTGLLAVFGAAFSLWYTKLK